MYAFLLYTYPGYPGGGSGRGLGHSLKCTEWSPPPPLALHRFRPMCSLGHLAHVHPYTHAQSDEILAQRLQNSMKNGAQNDHILLQI